MENNISPTNHFTILDWITLVYVHPEVKNWIKYAGFEESHSYIGLSRGVYERAVEFYGEEHMDEKLYISFAKFEERQKEVCWLFVFHAIKVISGV